MSSQESYIPVYAIIRVRGTVNCPYDVNYTLKLLRLHKKYHCTLYPATLPGLKNMLLKASGWITWGEVNKETLILLLKERGRIPGNRKLTDEYVDRHFAKYGVKGGISALADAILQGKIYLHKVEHLIKPVFRLHPPRGGFKGTIKRPYSQGGELGYRGPAINELLIKMI
ncbi:MAG: 50S ribosomal protein L30 [Desulfurococcaceae archaeon]|jgi:large subunit ribosomal protein L30|nr:50S ribosomal protein L30 [Desulfurococcaceae archaeon]